jgi:hypothetical protein
VEDRQAEERSGQVPLGIPVDRSTLLTYRLSSLLWSDESCFLRVTLGTNVVDVEALSRSRRLLVGDREGDADAN